MVRGAHFSSPLVREPCFLRPPAGSLRAGAAVREVSGISKVREQCDIREILAKRPVDRALSIARLLPVWLVWKPTHVSMDEVHQIHERCT